MVQYWIRCFAFNAGHELSFPVKDDIISCFSIDIIPSQDRARTQHDLKYGVWSFKSFQDRHVGELKNKAIDFIARNVQAVTDCDDWKNLVNVPVLMTDVVRAMASRPN